MTVSPPAPMVTDLQIPLERNTNFSLPTTATTTSSTLQRSQSYEDNLAPILPSPRTLQQTSASQASSVEMSDVDSYYQFCDNIRKIRNGLERISKKSYMQSYKIEQNIFIGTISSQEHPSFKISFLCDEKKDLFHIRLLNTEQVFPLKEKVSRMLNFICFSYHTHACKESPTEPDSITPEEIFASHYALRSPRGPLISSKSPRSNPSLQNFNPKRMFHSKTNEIRDALHSMDPLCQFSSHFTSNNGLLEAEISSLSDPNFTLRFSCKRPKKKWFISILLPNKMEKSFLLKGKVEHMMEFARFAKISVEEYIAKQLPEELGDRGFTSCHKIHIGSYPVYFTLTHEMKNRGSLLLSLGIRSEVVEQRFIYFPSQVVQEKEGILHLFPLDDRRENTKPLSLSAIPSKISVKQQNRGIARLVQRHLVLALHDHINGFSSQNTSYKLFVSEELQAIKNLMVKKQDTLRIKNKISYPNMTIEAAAEQKPDSLILTIQENTKILGHIEIQCLKEKSSIGRRFLTFTRVNWKDNRWIELDHPVLGPTFGTNQLEQTLASHIIYITGLLGSPLERKTTTWLRFPKDMTQKLQFPLFHMHFPQYKLYASLIKNQEFDEIKIKERLATVGYLIKCLHKEKSVFSFFLLAYNDVLEINCSTGVCKFEGIKTCFQLYTILEGVCIKLSQQKEGV